MSAQHTQDGPWVDAGMTGSNPRTSGGPLHLVKCKGVVIAYIPAWLADEREEAKANVRLIAAAPDLLEALQRLLPHAGWMESCSHDDDGIKRDIERARAAIAAATGAQP